MSVFDLIEEKCKKYPHLRHERRDNSFTIFPQSETGFPVSYSFESNEHIVAFLGWHEHFENPLDAFNCFGFGLSNKCRLQVRKKGSFQYRWAVESQNEDGSWQSGSVVGLLFFPFWKKTETIILQNDLVS